MGLDTEVLYIVNEECTGDNLDELTLDSDLREEGVDSLDIISTVVKLEKRYGIHFSDDEAESITTVRHFYDLTKTKVAANLNKSLKLTK